MPDTLLCAEENCGGDNGPRVAIEGLVLCRWHLDRLHRDVEITPLLMRWLSLHTTPGGRVAEPVSGSREAAVPVRLDVLSMILPGAVHPPPDDDDQTGPPSIPSTLAAWLWQVCEERGLVGPERWDDVGELVRYLRPHLGWCAGRSWAGQMSAEMAALRRCAHGLVPWKIHRAEKGVPCPACDALALVQVAGEDYVECDEQDGGCGKLLNSGEYDSYTAVLTWQQAA